MFPLHSVGKFGLQRSVLGDGLGLSFNLVCFQVVLSITSTHRGGYNTKSTHQRDGSQQKLRERKLQLTEAVNNVQCN